MNKFFALFIIVVCLIVGLCILNKDFPEEFLPTVGVEDAQAALSGPDENQVLPSDPMNINRGYKGHLVPIYL